ncbi:Peptide chain release factor [Perkinsus chesapeaki]|uniref:Peptide chain release factor n=1 Tax=Perkinsus chesapeaki TaxID=330153 RepID=A0A7J6L313_PERCH|nr:Peptide chain release factor [Perkinsus chesapeaki]
MSVLLATLRPSQRLRPPSSLRPLGSRFSTLANKPKALLLPTALLERLPDDTVVPVVSKLFNLKAPGDRPELTLYYDIVDEMISITQEIEKLKEDEGKLDRQETLMKEMFQSEIDTQIGKFVEVEERLFAHLHSRMSTEGIECATWHEYVKDANDCTVEIRPGVGGVEAGKWCKDVYDMFDRLSALMGWAAPDVKVMEQDSLPQTSACSVVVLPREDPNSNLLPILKPHEYKIWITKKSSGPGGQCVNAAHQAVRVRHIETGLEGFADCYRALKSNKALALQQLSQKIMDEKAKRIAKERGIIRKLHMGSGDRSEKIRSYNYLNGTAVDHRLPKPDDGPLALESVLAGDGLLHDMIEPLRDQEYRRRVQEYVCYELMIFDPDPWSTSAPHAHYC